MAPPVTIRTIANGRYRLVRPLAQGGMALVCEAVDEQLQVVRALKVLLPEFAQRAWIRERFEAEARTLARLDHPHIVRIHEVETAGPLPFITMELLEGGTLMDWLEACGTMPPQHAVGAVRQVCLAAEAAHAAGVIHRDIKPQNVLVDPQGTCKLTDFGIARVDDARLTRTGAVMGTLGYMAPEQRSDAKSVDVRADVYSLGVTLWKLLTGGPVENLALELAERGLVEVPAPLRPVLERCLAYRPDDRYPSVAALRGALDEAGGALPPERSPARSAPTTRPSPGPTDFEPIAALLDPLSTHTFLLEDPEPSELLLRDGQPVVLSGVQQRILDCLLANRGRFVPREELLRQAWPLAPHTLDGAFAGLKAKVEADPGQPQHLVTRFGHGYCLRVAPQQAEAAPAGLLPLGNLSPPRDRFVGRTDELSTLTSTVQAQQHRLVVLVGPGGMGKTRLALQVAGAVGPELIGGAWALDLSSARTEQDVCRAVARGLDVELGEQDPARQLGRVLAGKGRVLVVLDNLEQCVDVLPRALGAWLDDAPDATFLCTSRVPLGLRGEHVVRLDAMPCPDAGALFRERAPRGIEPDEAAELDALCQALGGMPLAVELAAARAQVLDVAAIRERLSLRLLSKGSRERSLRHRSLTASLDWSFALLSEAAQAALGQLSVFEGGATLQAAEAVLELPDAAEALWAIEELVEASLLRVASPQFSMLEIVREYGATTLGDAQRRRAELRHGACFARLTAPHPRDLRNLVAACRRAVARGDGSVAAVCLRSGWSLLELAGPFPFAADLAAQVARLPLTAADRASTELVFAIASRLAGRYEVAADGLHRLLRTARDDGDRRMEGLAQTHLAVVRYGQGRAEEACALGQAALAVLREVGDPEEEGLALGNLAMFHHALGEVEVAGRTYDLALALHRRGGAPRAEGRVLANLGVLLEGLGELEAAGVRYDAALAACRGAGDRRSEALVRSNLGLLRSQQGRSEDAQAQYEAALTVLRDVGDRRTEAVVLGNLGLLFHERGAHGRARALLERALAAHQEVGNRRSVGIVLGNLALVHGDEGRLEEAVRCSADAVHIHREVGDGGAEAKVLCQRACLHLGQGRAAEAAADYATSLRLLQEVGDRRMQGHVLGRIAALRLHEGDVEGAAAALDEGEPLLVAAGDPALLARFWSVRAELQLAGGDRERAAVTLARAEAVAPPEHRSAQAAVARVRGLL